MSDDEERQNLRGWTSTALAQLQTKAKRYELAIGAARGWHAQSQASI
jgi:hypothetical protein